jgi:hypothetical protein
MTANQTTWKHRGVLLPKSLYNDPLSLPSPRKAGRGWPQAGRGVRANVSLKHFSGGFRQKADVIGQSRRILINTWLQPGELPDGKHRITVLTVFRAPVITDLLQADCNSK